MNPNLNNEGSVMGTHKCRVHSHFDSGTATILEDALIIAPPFFGVLDGVSGLYHPREGPRWFDGVSGGQEIVRIVAAEFLKAQASEPLDHILRKANAAIRQFAEGAGIPLDRSDLLPGAQFVVAKVGDDAVEMTQCGDSLAVWAFSDGRVGAFLNQTYAHERSLVAILDNLREKHQGDRDRIWEEYLPISARARRERANRGGDNGYAVLNGQPQGEELWARVTLPRDELSLLLLFTDGLVTLEETNDPAAMAGLILGRYREGGWVSVFKRIRDWEDELKGMRHIDHAEATGVALEFVSPRGA